MSKFYQKSGLTAYALACGYLQVARLEKNGVVKEFILQHSGGAVYDVKVRTTDCSSVVGSTWFVFESLVAARSEWARLVKEELPKLDDSRYTIAREYCGADGLRYVLRFCGEFVGTADTLLGAKCLAVNHKNTA